MRTPRSLLWSATALIALVTPSAARAEPPAAAPVVTQLVTGLASGSGSTVGPDGALYVTEGATGTVLRVNPDTGEVATFATGLPSSIVGIGGAMDIAFIGGTAYVLVTLVGPDVGGEDVVGIYRADGPTTFTPIADIGQFSLDNPPTTSFDIPTGVQYALDEYRGGLLVTDGHLNRVLHVSLDGEITELIQFGNIVPTGLAIRGKTVYMAAAGPVPHLPEDGSIIAFSTKSPDPVEVASGARLLVDVELGRGRDLFALSQGVFAVGDPAGAPAMPNTGSLVEVGRDGTFSVIVEGLDQPTSLEIIGTTAFVVTLVGDIVRIDNVSAPPHGRSR